MGKGLISEIKSSISKSGNNKKQFIYFKPGNKVRIRFLHEIDDGMKVTFHDSYAAGVNVPCQDHFGRDCDYCGNDDLRTRDLYCWSVWDYDANEVKILMGAANNFSPIPNLVGLSETYGTIMDRDYVITKNGSQQNTSFTVAPMDRVAFKNKAAKPYSDTKVLKIIDKAFPADSDVEDDEDEDDAPKKAPKKSSKPKKPDYDDEDDEDEDDVPAPKKSSKAKKKPDPDDDDDDDDEDAEDNYEDMDAKELYQLCKKRKLDVEPKKTQKYYIKVLEAADDENDEEDDW